MVPYKGTLTIPQVNPDLCIGCGGCESICPVRPMRAIIIKANDVHKQVEKPKQEEVKEIEVTDFGFYRPRSNRDAYIYARRYARSRKGCSHA